MYSRSIVIHLVEVTEDVGQGLVFLRWRRAGETWADALHLLQRPVNDDRVGQLICFSGEGLDLQITEATGVDESELGERFSTSDVFVDCWTLFNIIRFS